MNKILKIYTSNPKFEVLWVMQFVVGYILTNYWPILRKQHFSGSQFQQEEPTQIYKSDKHFLLEGPYLKDPQQYLWLPKTCIFSEGLLVLGYQLVVVPPTIADWITALVRNKSTFDLVNQKFDLTWFPCRSRDFNILQCDKFLGIE